MEYSFGIDFPILLKIFDDYIMMMMIIIKSTDVYSQSLKWNIILMRIVRTDFFKNRMADDDDDDDGVFITRRNKSKLYNYMFLLSFLSYN